LDDCRWAERYIVWIAEYIFHLALEIQINPGRDWFLMYMRLTGAIVEASEFGFELN
jgi:hypothetical protein